MGGVDRSCLTFIRTKWDMSRGHLETFNIKVHSIYAPVGGAEQYLLCDVIILEMLMNVLWLRCCKCTDKYQSNIVYKKSILFMYA